MGDTECGKDHNRDVDGENVAPTPTEQDDQGKHDLKCPQPRQKPDRQPGLGEHCLLVNVVKEEFWHESVPEPYGREAGAGQTMDEGEPECGFGCLSTFSPQTKAVEAPGSCPAHQRPEEHPVDQPPQTAKAHFVVVPGKES